MATVSGGRAWVMRISLAAAWRRRGIGSAMLGELERRLVAAGVHRIQCLLAGDSEIGALALEHAGYTARRGMVFYERLEPVHPGSAGVLASSAGAMIRAGAWDQLGGMVREKELIERRVILPLAQPQLAGRLGLVPPRAIVLFGPPGTGKTSFAKGVASRLGWPFVELFPSRLAGESPAGLAAALREAFALIAELDKVVVFIDEVEEIAGVAPAAHGLRGPGRHQRDAQAHPAVPRAGRAAAHLRHQLGPRPGQRVLAARPVRLRDPSRAARPGRAARRSGTATWPRSRTASWTWRRSSTESRLFTPADIEFAARRTAQLAFERVLFEHGKEEVTTADVLQGIARPGAPSPPSSWPNSSRTSRTTPGCRPPEHHDEPSDRYLTPTPPRVSDGAGHTGRIRGERGYDKDQPRRLS